MSVVGLDVILIRLKEPDFRLPRLADYLDGHLRTALLVVEVCVSSEERDREKAALYADAGVPVYWIVHAEAHRIDVMRCPRDGQYTLEPDVMDGQSVQSLAVPGLEVSVTDVVPPA